MGYVETALGKNGTELTVDIRGKKIPTKVGTVATSEEIKRRGAEMARLPDSLVDFRTGHERHRLALPERPHRHGLRRDGSWEEWN